MRIYEKSLLSYGVNPFVAQSNEAKENSARDGKRVFFVAPKMELPPDDGFLTFVTLDSFEAFVSAPKHCVLMVQTAHGTDEASLAQLLVQNSPLIGAHFTALLDVPGAEYRAFFEDIVAGAERVSYPALISELALSEEHRQLLESQEPKQAERFIDVSANAVPNDDNIDDPDEYE